MAKLILEPLRATLKTCLSVLARLHPYKYISVRGARHTIYDLRTLDKGYFGMQQAHVWAHKGLITELGSYGMNNVLEIACGSGWCIPFFLAEGLEYYGLDISETAISMAVLKYPENRFFNLGVSDLGILKPDSFDVVYNSSMLEHIGYYEEAIIEMARLARKHLFILFFQGLSSGPTHSIKFHPFRPDEIDGTTKNAFGRKYVLQDHVHADQKGWYWNRYSEQLVRAFLDRLGYRYEIWDNTNRDYLRQESVVHIIKE